MSWRGCQYQLGIEADKTSLIQRFDSVFYLFLLSKFQLVFMVAYLYLLLLLSYVVILSAGIFIHKLLFIYDLLPPFCWLQYFVDFFWGLFTFLLWSFHSVLYVIVTAHPGGIYIIFFFLLRYIEWKNWVIIWFSFF